MTFTEDQLRAKLADAEEHLADAENVRGLLAVDLADAETPERRRDFLTVELHAADLRVTLYRQVVEKLRAELGVRSPSAEHRPLSSARCVCGQPWPHA